MKRIAFAGSNSSQSINYRLLEYIKEHYLTDLDIIDLRKMNLPMFSVDLEGEIKSPKSIVELMTKITDADQVLIGSPEHNGNFTAFLKSTIDWLSRLDKDFLLEKDIFICGTSPGRGGAAGSIQNTENLCKRLKGNVITTFSLPSFNHVFENGNLNEEETIRLEQFINQFPN